MAEEKAATGTPQPFAPLEISESSPASSLPPPLSTPPRWRRIVSKINYIPPWCRYDPAAPPSFSMGLNILFGFAGAFTVANLYYSHPILNILADDFGVSNETATHVPTLMQAGYACGLIFLCPLGDLFKRRPFVLCLVLFTSTIWIALCVTKSFSVFLGISFIVAITTVTPQIMLPLVGDLAPPHRRATALSIVVSGNLLGILLARILSGVVTQYTSWRNIYWLALGLQYVIFMLLWLFMPDYPSTNPQGINYFRILWSIVCLPPKHPVLVQASLISMLLSATFTSYWTTLTFLLAGAPYHYTPLVIGLFALIGIGAMALGPVYAKLLITRFVPSFSVVIGASVNLIGIIIGTYSGRVTVAGPIIQAFAMDAGLQITQVANRSAIYAIAPKARNRVNTVFMLGTFCGQLIGTAAGNALYARGGWVASGSLSVGLMAMAFVIAIARGPWEEGWIGWHGGWSIRKKDVMSADGKTDEGKDGKGVAERTDEEAVSGTGASVEKALEELAAEEHTEGGKVDAGEGVKKRGAGAAVTVADEV